MKQVLFVDLRNAIRSQIAEAWFNEFAAGWGQARSCGTMPAERVDSLAVIVMAEMGLDIRRQAPKAVNQQMLSQADLVVIMGPDVYPRAFAPDRIWDFLDPTGQSVVHYRVQRDAIRQRVQEFILEIQRVHFEPNEGDWRITALLQHQLMTEFLYK
jgi:arsenate reductase (thioredoxin)